MNHTFDWVLVEVPTASLPPEVHVGSSPGPRGASWAAEANAKIPERRETARRHFMRVNELPFRESGGLGAGRESPPLPGWPG